MSSETPAYYSELAPFRALFRRSNPILTYHKLGPRPSQVRLKGLYVSQQLFTHQMKELRAAGFAGGSLAEWNQPNENRVIVTFDDGYLNVLRYGLDALATHKLRAIQFLPVNFLGLRNEWDVANGEAPEPIMNRSQVKEWISAGHEIGSHSLSHPFLTRLSLPAAREEIAASRRKLEDLFGRGIDHFCYPYGDWNPAVRDMVQEAGYKTACTTESGINDPTGSCFALKRFTARYASRNLKSVWGWLRACWNLSTRENTP
jgi:peptidoglycan/xylan/chitin deacetylase (PgdA/CDA1 family)